MEQIYFDIQIYTYLTRWSETLLHTSYTSSVRLTIYWNKKQNVPINFNNFINYIFPPDFLQIFNYKQLYTNKPHYIVIYLEQSQVVTKILSRRLISNLRQLEYHTTRGSGENFQIKEAKSLQTKLSSDFGPRFFTYIDGIDTKY